MRSPASYIAWITTGLAAAATLFAQLDRLGLGDAGWLFDLFAQFPKHWAVVSLLALVVTAVMRRWGLLLLATAALAANLTSLAFAPAFATPKPAPPGAMLIRIASANVHDSPEALARLAAMARDYKAGLVSVYEAPLLSGPDLLAMFPGARRIQLVDRGADSRPLSKRMLVVSWTEVGPVGVKRSIAGQRAVLGYAVSGVQVIAAHPVSPGSPADMHDRDLMLASLAGDVDPRLPFLVMGDLNATPFSHIFRTLPGVRAGDPRAEASFPAQAPWLGIPIDSFLFGGGLQLVEEHVGGDLGSDHLPIFATFALPSGGLPAGR